MNNNNKYTTLAAWPLAVCLTLESQGFDPDPILANVGIDRKALQNNPDGRVDTKSMTQFWQQVEHVTGDAAFALSVSRYVQPMHLRALGLLFITCDNLEEALLKASQYHSLISNAIYIRLLHGPGTLGFCIDPLPDFPIHPMAIESFLATLVFYAQHLQVDGQLFTKIQLKRPAPADPTPFKKHFKCEIEFGANQYCLHMERDKLKHTQIMGDAQMAAFNEGLVKNYVEALGSRSWSARVKQILTASLEQSEPQIAQIAAQLKVSERSLRRYLKEEEQSFRALLSQVRMDRAQYYLSETDLSITDIALRLGFTDTSNFSRAFTRYTDYSPSVFRQQHKGLL